MNLIYDIFWVFPATGLIILIVFGSKKIKKDHEHTDICEVHYDRLNKN